MVDGRADVVRVQENTVTGASAMVVAAQTMWTPAQVAVPAAVQVVAVAAAAAARADVWWSHRSSLVEQG